MRTAFSDNQYQHHYFTSLCTCKQTIEVNCLFACACEYCSSVYRNLNPELGGCFMYSHLQKALLKASLNVQCNSFFTFQRQKKKKNDCQYWLAILSCPFFKGHVFNFCVTNATPDGEITTVYPNTFSAVSAVQSHQ